MHLVHDLNNEMDQISDIRSPKGVFDQQIVADRFDMNDDACRRVNIFCMPDVMTGDDCSTAPRAVKILTDG